MFEDDGMGDFESEVMMQAFESARTFRPRLLIYGVPGMGQQYLGSAILHHLEKTHVQSFDLATLMGDSARVCIVWDCANVRPLNPRLSNYLLR